MNHAQFSRRGYITNSTPIEARSNFSKPLGGKVNIWIKRDDLPPGHRQHDRSRHPAGPRGSHSP